MSAYPADPTVENIFAKRKRFSLFQCKKAEDGCDEDDEGDATGSDKDIDVVDCGALIFEPDCAAQTACLWCTEQMTCNQVEVDCGTVAATVAMDIEYGSPAFRLSNEALGDADPKGVNVKLNYLFEVAEDGSEIPFSFVDVQNQAFSVSQIEGVSLGVLSRKTTFTAEIVGVGSIELIVYKMLEDGEITTPWGETFPVAKGGMYDWLIVMCASIFVLPIPFIVVL